MARPLEFDRDQALMKATGLFWRKGYHATSIPDLLDALEIGRSSLYAAFGDKRALFLECVDAYVSRTLALLAEVRAGNPPLSALRLFFERTLPQPGCLLVNTALEMADVDSGLRDHAAARMGEVRAAFEACLRDAGCGDDEAARLASFLMLVNQGLRVSSRLSLPPEALCAQLDTTFQVLATALDTANEGHPR